MPSFNPCEKENCDGHVEILNVKLMIYEHLKTRE